MQLFYQKIDQTCTVLQAKNQGYIHFVCDKGCHQCCVDDIEVFEAEADYIRLHASTLLAHGEPHPVGKCAFLDAQGACRIYPYRPYVCRSQGLPLRWKESETQTEWRDICPLNEPSETSLTEMPEENFFNMTAFDNYLAILQMQRSGLDAKRIRLRDLFVKKS